MLSIASQVYKSTVLATFYGEIDILSGGKLSYLGFNVKFIKMDAFV